MTLGGVFGGETSTGKQYVFPVDTGEFLPNGIITGRMTEVHVAPEPVAHIIATLPVESSVMVLDGEKFNHWFYIRFELPDGRLQTGWVQTVFVDFS